MPPLDRMNERRPFIEQQAETFTRRVLAGFLSSLSSGIEMNPTTAVFEGAVSFSDRPWQAPRTAEASRLDFVGKFRVLVGVLANKQRVEKQDEWMIGLLLVAYAERGVQYIPMWSREFATVCQRYNLERQEASEEHTVFKSAVASKLFSAVDWSKVLNRLSLDKHSHTSGQIVWEATD